MKFWETEYHRWDDDMDEDGRSFKKIHQQNTTSCVRKWRDSQTWSSLFHFIYRSSLLTSLAGLLSWHDLYSSRVLESHLESEASKTDTVRKLTLKWLISLWLPSLLSLEWLTSLEVRHYVSVMKTEWSCSQVSRRMVCDDSSIGNYTFLVLPDLQLITNSDFIAKTLLLN